MSIWYYVFAKFPNEIALSCIRVRKRGGLWGRESGPISSRVPLSKLLGTVVHCVQHHSHMKWIRIWSEKTYKRTYRRLSDQLLCSSFRLCYSRWLLIKVVLFLLCLATFWLPHICFPISLMGMESNPKYLCNFWHVTMRFFLWGILSLIWEIVLGTAPGCCPISRISEVMSRTWSHVKLTFNEILILFFRETQESHKNYTCLSWQKNKKNSAK